MESPSLPPPKLIKEATHLRGLVNTLCSQPRLAVDTESNSLHAYQEQVCLIQFSIPGTDYLVDPLTLPDLSQLAQLFANSNIEKVFHGAEYDVMCLKRDFGFAFVNLFDTRIACRTLGRKPCGLQNNLAEEFGVQISKRYQRANWGRRPLPLDMLDYARMDTHFLLPLRDRLAEALQAAGRWEEAHEACEYLANINAHHNGFNPEGYWRISNSYGLSRRQTALLRELYLYRDDQARRRNRPPFKILRDRTLIMLAQANPSGLKALRNLPGMTPGQIQRYGEGILSALQRGRRATIPTRPRSKPFDEAVHNRYEALHAWRKRVARKRRVESDIILPREVLLEIARIAPRDAESLQTVMQPLMWRFQAYGQEILKVLWRGSIIHDEG